MNWLTISITGFELLGCLTQLTRSLLAYLTGHTLLLFLCRGLNDKTRILVDFLLDVKLLIEEFHIQSSDLLILPVKQFKFVFFIYDITNLDNSSCHFLLHCLTWNQMGFNLFVLIDDKCERLVEVDLLGCGEAFGCLELLFCYATYQSNKSALFWGILQ